MFLLLMALCADAQSDARTARHHAKDFAQFWGFVSERYAFLSETATDWEAVGAALAPQAAAAGTREDLVAVLEDALDQLYDPHCMLNTNTGESWRPVPYGVYAEWQNGRAVVTAVQGSWTGIAAGDEILAVDGKDLEVAVAQRRPRFLRDADPAAEAWALLSAVAGRHGGDHTLGVRRPDGAVAEVRFDDPVAPPSLRWERLESGIGRIEIHSFADAGLIRQFDAAVEALAGVDALVIDLRSNSGGDTAVAVPILGRLFSERVQYAWMARREGVGLGERWPEYIEPRAPTIQLPIAVVVDRFTVSMGEGFAMALQKSGRGVIVGTEMAGLGAAIARVKLRKSDIAVQISAEPIFAVDGTPRSDLVPDIVVDPTAPGDPFLDAAVAALAARDR